MMPDFVFGASCCSMKACCSLCHLTGRFEFWPELGEFSKVLGGCGKEEFVTGTAWASEAKATKP